MPLKRNIGLITKHIEYFGNGYGSEHEDHVPPPSLKMNYEGENIGEISQNKDGDMQIAPKKDSPKP